ncbi:MAG: PqqD family protein [Bradyrhizobium sp.]|uniref:PqqD family protein n=1 Tax=Bradyrhizobium sp. TaxID=376 RepID=UPI00271B357B|nr:PqqD family protein [Bradyrhizobium sp.]MDO8398047.1 PqqD family protein [Bradyrhizobium sp.]
MHIRLAPGTTLTNVEGKDVLFSVKTGDSYGLNETAARMLRLGLEADLDEVVNRLAGEYGAERQEIRDDFEELVAELVQLKFTQLVSTQGG